MSLIINYKHVCVCVWLDHKMLFWGVFQNAVVTPWSRKFQFSMQKPGRTRSGEIERKREIEETWQQCGKHTFKTWSSVIALIPPVPVYSTFCKHILYILFPHPKWLLPQFFYQKDHLESLRLSSVAMASLRVF